MQVLECVSVLNTMKANTAPNAVPAHIQAANVPANLVNRASAEANTLHRKLLAAVDEDAIVSPLLDVVTLLLSNIATDNVPAPRRAHSVLTAVSTLRAITAKQDTAQGIGALACQLQLVRWLTAGMPLLVDSVRSPLSASRGLW